MLNRLIFTLIVSVFLLAPVGNAVAQTVLPPKASDELYVMVPPGVCQSGLTEIGTFKPEINEVWTRSPRRFISVCEVFVEKIFIARYRLAARCVDTNDQHTPLSPWVRSHSGLNKPWPEGCPGNPTGNPINPAMPETE